MKARIIHESRGRIRFGLYMKKMSLKQADQLENWLLQQKGINEAVVHERTLSVMIRYSEDRQDALSAIARFSYDRLREEELQVSTSRALDRQFQEKLVFKVLMKATSMLFFPRPIRIARCLIHMVPFMKRGLHCILHRQMKVELLDAISVGISGFRGDFSTASMVMFLLEIGEALEDWTRRRSIEDLARCMSLNVDRVWLKTESGAEVLTPIHQIHAGDCIVLRAGGLVPVDGTLSEGEVTVNQASLTGESIPVSKRPGGILYAGTVIEEG